MKKSIIISVIALISSCNPCPKCPVCPTTNTAQFTDVTIRNSSDTIVQCFLTVPSTDSPVGKFGISSDSLNAGKTTGWFWLKQGEVVHLNSTIPSMGYIITFGAQNAPCSQSTQQGWLTGINNFEFTLNCFDTTLNKGCTGGNESADITNVDGVNALIGYQVDTAEGKIGRKFWDYSLTDSTGELFHFNAITSSGQLFGDCNKPGIFPYDCDVCYAHSAQAPTPCFPLPVGYNCSYTLAQGNLYTCQINRPGQGGTINVTFYGFSNKPQPAMK